MDVIKSYNDLCEEIEIWKERIKAYEAEYRAIANLARLNGPSDIKAIDYTQPAVQTSGQLGLEEALIRLQKIESHIQLHIETVERLEVAKDTIEKHIEKLDGLDRKVVYMRDVEGMTLARIAEKLGYSEIYIKKISAKNKRVY